MPPRDLATLWVEKRPLVQQTSSGPAVTCAADLFGPSSHLEHRDVSRSGRAHCVRWVARLYQKPSLSCHRWVMTGQFDWVPEAFTCPASLDRPGRLGARSLHLSCLIGQARTTGLRSTLASETSVSRVADSFGDSVPGVSDSLVVFPPPFFGSLGSDFHRLCHGPTFLTHNLK